MIDTNEKQLRVLFIEDSEDDMLLELNEIKSSGYNVEFVRVDNETGLVKELSKPWDVVISDYNMPLFTGSDALQVIKQHDLDIPFILVSGVIGEIKAVNLIKDGVNDYIIKDRLARLVPAIEREVKEAKNRSAYRDSQIALEKSELHHRTLLETITDAIMVIDERGIIESCNPATHILFGYSKDEIIGKNINIIIPEPYSSYHESIDNISHIIGIERETKAILKSGAKIDIDLSVNKIDMEGTTRFTCVARDISDRKKTENDLLIRSMQLSEAQSIAHIGNWILDIKTNELQWSSEVFRIFGLQENDYDVSLDKFMKSIHNEDREHVRKSIKQTIEKGQPYDIEHRILLPDASIRFVQEHGEVRYDASGVAIQMIGTVQDITESKLVQRALVQSEKRFRATFDQAAVGIAHVSIDGNLLRVNQRLCEIVSYQHDVLLTKTFDDITFSEDVGNDLNLINELLENKRKSYVLEKRYLRKDGSLTWVNLTVSLVRDHDGKPDYFISVIEDINARKMAEDMMFNSLHEKDTLLRELHHRVKNNMQIISSILSLQSRNLHSADPKQLLEESRQRIRAIALIHERMYNVSDLTKVNFKEYVRYLAERLTRMQYQDNKQIAIQVSGDNLNLSVDQALPSALIVNELLTNSIKHAYSVTDEKNKIQLIEVRLENQSDGSPCIYVRDYGSGISDNAIENTDESLGLLIIKALTKQLNGTLEYDINGGTLASVRFPSTVSQTNRLVA